MPRVKLIARCLMLQHALRTTAVSSTAAVCVVARMPRLLQYLVMRPLNVPGILCLVFAVPRCVMRPPPTPVYVGHNEDPECLYKGLLTRHPI